MDRQQLEELIQAARGAYGRAYAKYSGCQVGAALRSESGAVFAGCNVENASYGLTICAERNAVAAAISAGESHFEAMAVVSFGGCLPCGACLQVLAEFCSELDIYLVDADQAGPAQQRKLTSLFPAPFALPR